MRRALAMLAGALVLGGCGGDGEDRVRVVCSDPPKPTVEGAFLVSLPASTRRLSVKCGGFMDTTYHARFTIDRDDLPRFVRSAQFTGPLKAGERPFQGTQGLPPDWKVDAIQTVSGHTDDCFNKTSRKCTRVFAASSLVDRVVMVDLDDPQQVVVYLYGYTT